MIWNESQFLMCFVRSIDIYSLPDPANVSSKVMPFLDTLQRGVIRGQRDAELRTLLQYRCSAVGLFFLLH